MWHGHQSIKIGAPLGDRAQACHGTSVQVHIKVNTKNVDGEHIYAGQSSGSDWGGNESRTGNKERSDGLSWSKGHSQLNFVRYGAKKR